MKNKRLLVILIIFGVITLAVILGSAVFTVSSVELKWETTTNIFSTVDSDDIIDAGDFDMGQSVFLSEKQTYIDNIERAYPYIQVVNIETVFPNKLVVHVAEREPIYALKVTDSNNSNDYAYVMLDKYFKVLTISNLVLPSNTTPIVLEIDGSTLVDTEFNVGQVASFVEHYTMFNSFVDYVKSYGFHPVNIYGSMTVQFGYNTTLTIDPIDNEEISNITVLIQDANTRLKEKVEKSLQTLEYLKAQGVGGVTIDVRVGSDNNIVVTSY